MSGFGGICGSKIATRGQLEIAAAACYSVLLHSFSVFRSPDPAFRRVAAGVGLCCSQMQMPQTSCYGLGALGDIHRGCALYGLQKPLSEGVGCGLRSICRANAVTELATSLQI